MRVVVAWSGGKDAAYALYELPGSVEVLELLTTVDRTCDRSSMHRVHRVLHERQADALDVAWNAVELPPEPSNEQYEQAMAATMDRYADRGVDRIVFADLFLEDIREYRERRLSGQPIAGHWPVWGRDTERFVESVLGAGFRATVVAVDGSVLGPEFVGRELDESLLADLPDGVDPCGEYGEFHTFVWDGPPFDRPIEFELGERTTRAVGESEIHHVELDPR